MESHSLNRTGKVHGTGKLGSSRNLLDQTSDRFYPVRVYDGKGNLKYELDSKKVQLYAEEQLESGKNWKANRQHAPRTNPVKY